MCLILARACFFSSLQGISRAYMDAVNPFENKETEGLSPNINTNTNSSKSSFYYELYPFKEDGGYLHRLVSECRSSLLELPHYNRVQEEVTKLAQLYCDLQTYKHIALDKREKALMEWAQRCDCKRFGISTWEFAAASGSTLGIFMLCALASGKTKPGTEQVSNIVNAYFPWICGFHILLDYFIDQMEDRENHDLNFTFYYRNRVEEKERLVLFASRALAASRRLPNKNFHCLVVKGLASMYLSDIKAGIDGTTREISREILEISGLKAILMHKLCNFLRVKELL